MIIKTISGVAVMSEEEANRRFAKALRLMSEACRVMARDLATASKY